MVTIALVLGVIAAAIAFFDGWDGYYYRDLPSLPENYAYCVVDIPPHVSTLARTVILSANLLLIINLRAAIFFGV